MNNLKIYTERIETNKKVVKFKIKLNLLHIILKIITRLILNKSIKIEVSNKIRFQMHLKSILMILTQWLVSMISKGAKRAKIKGIAIEGEVLVIEKRIRIHSKIDTKIHQLKEIIHLIIKVIEKLLQVKKGNIIIKCVDLILRSNLHIMLKIN